MHETAALSAVQLDAYLTRIGHSGPCRADLATLNALHVGHLATFPFENVDVQLGNPPGLDPDAAFDKLVTRRRGGWCYEQNGLFGRVLATLGFAVSRISGGVLRQLRGDFVMGSHLCLKLALDGQDWLVDVGFGGGLLRPVPLLEGGWDDQLPIPVSLARTDDGYWRFAIQLGSAPMSYDFHDQLADETQLERLCDWQGNAAESVFVQNLVVQHRQDDEHHMLRGKVLTRTHAGGSEQRVLDSADALVAVLRDRFTLDVPAVAALWPSICARHAELFPE